VIKQITAESSSSTDTESLNKAFWHRLRQNPFSDSTDVLEVQNVVESGDTTVEQFAFLLVASPIPYSIKNPVTSNVYVRLSNSSVFSLDPDTITLRLDSVKKQDLSVVAFFGGNGGFDVTWTNDSNFDYGEQVNVEWEMYDTDSPPNRIVIEYWFRTVEDRIGPRLLNATPADDTTAVSVQTSLIFDITDAETGVDLTSFEFYVNNILVPTTDSSLVVLEITDGYRFTYITAEPYLYGDTVPVVVKVTDNSQNANQSFFIWTFETEGSTAPLLVNMDPAPCSTGVQRIKTVSFDIIDAGHGLVTSSIVMGIDSTTRDQALLIPIVRRQD